MSRRSLQDLVETARSLFKEHGTLSTAYLMRKLKVDYEEARKIMQGLGLPTYIDAEEYAMSMQKMR